MVLLGPVGTISSASVWLDDPFRSASVLFSKKEVVPNSVVLVTVWLTLDMTMSSSSDLVELVVVNVVTWEVLVLLAEVEVAEEDVRVLKVRVVLVAVVL